MDSLRRLLLCRVRETAGFELTSSQKPLQFGEPEGAWGSSGLQLQWAVPAAKIWKTEQSLQEQENEISFLHPKKLKRTCWNWFSRNFWRIPCLGNASPRELEFSRHFLGEGCKARKWGVGSWSRHWKYPPDQQFNTSGLSVSICGYHCTIITPSTSSPLKCPGERKVKLDCYKPQRARNNSRNCQPGLADDQKPKKLNWASTLGNSLTVGIRGWL